MSNIIVNVVGVVVTSVVLPLIVFLGKKLAEFLQSKINNERSAEMLERADALVTDVLKMTSQTLVDDLKKQGSFDKTAQSVALERAKCAISSNMSQQLKDFITKHYGNLEKWILIKIESEIYRQKK